MIKQTTKPTTDEIAADLFCSQVQTNADIGDSAFNHEIHDDLYGEDYADEVINSIGHFAAHYGEL